MWQFPRALNCSNSMEKFLTSSVPKRGQHEVNQLFGRPSLKGKMTGQGEVSILKRAEREKADPDDASETSVPCRGCISGPRGLVAEEEKAPGGTRRRSQHLARPQGIEAAGGD